MKKILIYLVYATAVITALGACKDKLEDEYSNPEQTTSSSIEKFFTRMLDNNRVRPSYWEYRTFVLPHAGVYTQTTSFTNSLKRYQQQFSYAEQRWNDYFSPGDNGGGIVAHYREIQKAYEAIPNDEKVKKEVFLKAAQVIYLDQTAQMVDLWGDIPFTEAGMLNLKGQILKPKFDEAKSIYTDVLNQLKEASDYFSSASLESVVAVAFKKQDILLGGDVEKWKRYTNSIRLRYLMRISFSDEATAKSGIAEILGNPSKYPLADEAKYDVLLQPLKSYTDNLQSALTEISAHIAPEFMLEKVMKPANDPRIPAFFDKYGHITNKVWIPNADYVGMPANLNSSDQETNVSKGLYAVLDSSTFIQNTKLPGIVITSAEVNFLKAEAYERWGGGDPKTVYEAAIKQSINFYYYLNSLGIAGDLLTTPSSGKIDAFLASPTIAYSGSQEEKLARTWTQKWLNFGFLQGVQAWAELRRTDYPKLTFLADNTSGYELPPLRLVYPGGEKIYNAANYSLVASQDLRGNKIFWDVK